MISRYRRWAVPALCGLLALAGCKTGAEPDVNTKSREIVDGLSSASILRVNRYTVAYVSKEGTSTYKLNTVNVNNPGAVTHTATIGTTAQDNVAIITATPDGSKIAVYTGEETAYETFSAKDIIIYNNSLVETNRFTVGAGVSAAAGHVLQPLHHRDPSLSITNDYVGVIWLDTQDAVGGTTTKQHYISVYDISGSSKAPFHVPAFTSSGAGNVAVNTALGIGTPVAAVIKGNYLLAGGAAIAGDTDNYGTRPFTIGSSGGNLTLTPGVAGDKAAPHWMKTNGEYVMESKAGNGKVKVWKWNAAAVPTAVGDIETTGTGNIQALSFDPDEPLRGYIYVKTNGNGYHLGDVLKVNLISRNAPVLFNFPQYKGAPLSGIWTIEKETSGTDTFFVLSGGYDSPTKGIALVVRNPPTDGSEVSGPIAVTEYTSAVRTLKVFKNNAGDVFYAAKNYTTNPIASSVYTMRLIRIGETGLPGTGL